MRVVSLDAIAVLLMGMGAACLGGCAPAGVELWALPDWPEARAFLVDLRESRGAQFVAFDREADSTALPFVVVPDDGIEATALGLAEPLAVYGLTPGPHALVPRAAGRPWPPTIRVAHRGAEDAAFVARQALDETPLAEQAIEANALCPPTTARSWPLVFGEPVGLVPLDDEHALIATETALYSVKAPRWKLNSEPLPGSEPFRSLWRRADGVILAGTAHTSQLYSGRWDGMAMRWEAPVSLDRPSALAALTTGGSGATYGVTQAGEVLRVSTEPTRVETLFSFRPQLMAGGAGVAVRDGDSIVAYANVDAGRIVYVEREQVRVESPFLGPLNVLASVAGIGVVAGSVLGFSVLAPGRVTFDKLGPAPLEPQALVETRDGFLALGTAGLVVRYDRRSGHSCPAQPVAAGQFRAAVALDDQTVVAIEQPTQFGQPLTVWHLSVPPLAF